MVSGNGSFKVNTGVQRLSSAGSDGSAAGNQVLLNSASDLLTGQIGIAVAGLHGSLAADEQTRIDDAVAALNSELGPLGVNLVEVSGASAAWAPIHLTLSDNSDIGGVAQGVLGVTEGRDITIINGWNYFVADTGTIGSAQYDFQTVVTHELGHALGLGHSPDTASVMYPYLAAGPIRRFLTTKDVASIGQEVETGAPEPLMALPVAQGDARLATPIGRMDSRPIVPLTGSPVRDLMNQYLTGFYPITPTGQNLRVPSANLLGNVLGWERPAGSPPLPAEWLPNRSDSIARLGAPMRGLADELVSSLFSHQDRQDPANDSAWLLDELRPSDAVLTDQDWTLPPGGLG
jgi:hypothetical protein